MSRPSLASRVEQTARESGLLDGVVRIGLVAYGIVHVLLALVAVRLVLGEHTTAATGQGGAGSDRRRTEGRVILGLLGVASSVRSGRLAADRGGRGVSPGVRAAPPADADRRGRQGRGLRLLLVRRGSAGRLRNTRSWGALALVHRVAPPEPVGPYW